MEKLVTADFAATRYPAVAISSRRFSCVNVANAFIFHNLTSSSSRWMQSTFTQRAGFSHLGTSLRRHNYQFRDPSDVYKRRKRHQFQLNKGVTAVINEKNEDEQNESLLQPNHKIFLSHSGAQKEEFVEQLCVELESRHRFAFYDKRPRSLPKGEKFPALIKSAVKQCEMMVVVVSEEYFRSKWPMIELHAFMEASEKNSKMRVLPLFFGLSMEEFNDKSRQQEWFKVWDTMSKADTRIKVDQWKAALKLLPSRNGMVYDRGSRDVVAYRKEVVSQICRAVSADIKHEDAHVQGRSHLSEVILQNFMKLSPKVSKARVMGIHGVGGIGKTTLCKILCNKLDGEFNAKVHHVELSSVNESGEYNRKVHHLQLVRKTLNALTNTSLEFAESLNEDQCRDILWKESSWKQKAFLAVDNVWDDRQSLEQAKMYLKAPFVDGSMVIVTSRFLKTLTSLGIDENACSGMPELGKEDAKKLFLYYAADGKQFESEEDVAAIDECIESCSFGKGKNRGSHYHPLALRVLGVQLHYLGDKRPSEWLKRLPYIRNSSHLQEPRNPLFSILRSNFDRLPVKEQDLFMDVAVFRPREYKYTEDYNYTDWHTHDAYSHVNKIMMEWLCCVHNEERRNIEIQLQHLKESALLEDVKVYEGHSISLDVSMHDLYREFANLESEGRLDESMGLEKRRWLKMTPANFMHVYETPGGRCWQDLKRVCIEKYCFDSMIISGLEGIEWEHFANVVVLRLHIGSGVQQEVLNLKGLKCLRSLDLGLGVVKYVEGLEWLKKLTFITMSRIGGLNNMEYHGEYSRVGRLPASLKVLDVVGPVIL